MPAYFRMRVSAVSVDPPTPLFKIFCSGLLCDIAQRANSNPVVLRYRDDANVITVGRVFVPQLDVTPGPVNDDEAVFCKCLDDVASREIA